MMGEKQWTACAFSRLAGMIESLQVTAVHDLVCGPKSPGHMHA